ncbi:MAG: hypothetical protein FE78DRAFT_77632 [Acidomyces sp. 'richmondensis']|nr:MAG: hypothetical protein FE78DRAFT_77632 [Acidomyces sp. 'richmondensis']
MTLLNKYADIFVEIEGSLITDSLTALREPNEYPDTTFTVLTGEGRLFSSGADVSSIAAPPTDLKNDGEKKLFWLQRFAMGNEMVRSLVNHRTVLVLALNRPAVGGGAAWFQGAWLQVNFSQLGLVPEFGSAVNLAQSMSIHKSNELFMFGRKIFPKESFQENAHEHLKEMLRERSGKSMIEVKHLKNISMRYQRIVALFNACNALAERFVDGEPIGRMAAKMQDLNESRKAKL